MSGEDSRTAGYLLALLAALNAAAAYLFAAAAVARMDVVVLGALEFLLALGPAALWAAQQGTHSEVSSIPARLWAMLALQSAFTFGAVLTLWIGLRLVAVTTASLLNRAEVVFTVVLGALLFRERHTFLEAAGGAIAFAGVLFLRWNAPPELDRGSLWILASALFFAAAETTAKWISPHLSASLFVLVRTPMMAVLFGAAALAVALHRGEAPRVPDAFGWAVVAGVAMCGPVLARAFYYAALRRIEISKAALINQSQPLFVALFTLVLFARLPAAREWTGGLLILGGTLLIVSRRRPRRSPPPEALWVGPD